MPCKVSTNVGKSFCQDGIFNSMKWVPLEIEWDLGAAFICVGQYVTKNKENKRNCVLIIIMTVK